MAAREHGYRVELHRAEPAQQRVHAAPAVRSPQEALGAEGQATGVSGAQRLGHRGIVPDVAVTTRAPGAPMAPKKKPAKMANRKIGSEAALKDDGDKYAIVGGDGRPVYPGPA